MSFTPPVVLYDNILHRFPVLAASATKPSSSVDFIRDWREGLRWEPPFDASPPSTETIDCFPVNGQLLDLNWYFRDWSLGISDVPDGWVKNTAGASVIRQHSGADRFIHDFSMELERIGGADIWASQNALRPELYRGKRIRAGAHVWTSVAGAARISVWDGTTLISSGFHGGGGGRTFLTTPALTVRHDAAVVQTRLEMLTSNGTARFDGAIMVQSDVAPAETPHAVEVDAFGFFDHNFGTDNVQVRALGSDDNFATTPDVIGPTTPANDDAFITRLAGGSTFTRRFWRMEFDPQADGQPARAGVGLLGLATDFPGPIVPGFAPLNRVLQSELPSNQDGAPLQRSVNRVPIPLDLVQEWVDDTDITGAPLFGFLEHAFGEGLPFLLRWAPADRPDQVFFAWVPEDADFDAPLQHALRANPVTVPLLGFRR